MLECISHPRSGQVRQVIRDGRAFRDWAEDLMASQRFAEREWTDALAVREMWRDLRNGKDQFEADIWRFLSVEAWARAFLDRTMETVGRRDVERNAIQEVDGR